MHCADLRLRQDRRRRARARAARARRQAALDRRHRQAAGRRRPAGHRGGRAHRLSRDARRPRQDAAPDDPRRPAGAARPCPSTWRRSTQHGIATIDLLVVNLYPFEATVAKPGCTLEDAIENIDIGGPAMVRSAAKNWKDVAVLTDASQYAGVLAELQGRAAGVDRDEVRAAVAAFNRIANYDAAISDYLSSLAGPSDGVPSAPPSRRRPTAASSSCRTCATARTRTRARRSTATCSPRPARW